MIYLNSYLNVDYFFISAVVMAEWSKLLTCLVLVFYEEGRDIEKFGQSLRKTIIENPVDTIKVCVPSLLYVIQNNLLYLSASHLDAATYQVSSIKYMYTTIFVTQIHQLINDCYLYVYLEIIG